MYLRPDCPPHHRLGASVPEVPQRPSAGMQLSSPLRMQRTSRQAPLVPTQLVSRGTAAPAWQLLPSPPSVKKAGARADAESFRETGLPSMPGARGPEGMLGVGGDAGKAGRPGVAVRRACWELWGLPGWQGTPGASGAQGLLGVEPGSLKEVAEKRTEANSGGWCQR